jgi:hypothetical protein
MASAEHDIRARVQELRLRATVRRRAAFANLHDPVVGVTVVCCRVTTAFDPRDADQDCRRHVVLVGGVREMRGERDSARAAKSENYGCNISHSKVPGFIALPGMATAYDGNSIKGGLWPYRSW